MSDSWAVGKVPLHLDGPAHVGHGSQRQVGWVASPSANVYPINATLNEIKDNEGRLGSLTPIYIDLDD